MTWRQRQLVLYALASFPWQGSRATANKCVVEGWGRRESHCVEYVVDERVRLQVDRMRRGRLSTRVQPNVFGCSCFRLCGRACVCHVLPVGHARAWGAIWQMLHSTCGAAAFSALSRCSTMMWTGSSNPGAWTNKRGCGFWGGPGALGLRVRVCGASLLSNVTRNSDVKMMMTRRANRMTPVLCRSRQALCNTSNCQDNELRPSHVHHHAARSLLLRCRLATKHLLTCARSRQWIGQCRELSKALAARYRVRQHSPQVALAAAGCYTLTVCLY